MFEKIENHLVLRVGEMTHPGEVAIDHLLGLFCCKEQVGPAGDLFGSQRAVEPNPLIFCKGATEALSGSDDTPELLTQSVGRQTGEAG